MLRLTLSLIIMMWWLIINGIRLEWWLGSYGSLIIFSLL